MATYEMENCVVFDVDQTVADSHGYDYANAKPIQHVVDTVNELYAAGVYIIFYTARYYRKFDGQLDKIYATGYTELTDWLAKYNVKYNRVVMGKPSGKWFIDDRAWPHIDDYGMAQLKQVMIGGDEASLIRTYTRDMEL